ncbi:MAG: glutathione S-transferase family protein [Oceanicaulis sp.]|nr:glutathione S-transferase family protein [Oceanicaulis sp.]
MITLYGSPTTNTRKVTIALAELGLSWTSRHVDLSRGEQHEDWFLALAPNNKIPVLKDDQTATTVYESGAILIYLAEQYDDQEDLLAKSGAHRYAAIQGAFFQAANIGPSLGRLNDQLNASGDAKVPGMQELFYNEALRLIEVMERMLGDGREFLAGGYSIADIMHYPWLKAGADLGFPALLASERLTGWLGRMAQRPGVKLGMSAFDQPQKRG